MHCPLCNINIDTIFSKDRKRAYLQCSNCSLIFVDPKDYISESDEIERYSLHTNKPDERGYEQFLSKIIPPALKYLTKNTKGLDFGCGPGPVLDRLFKPYDINIKNFDPNFKPDYDLLDQSWDFIISTEVIEHVKNPLEVLNQLMSLIKPNGVLILMTSLFTQEIEFKSWYYKGDPTHIMFYTKETFHWIADHYKTEIEFFDKNIIILKKS